MKNGTVSFQPARDPPKSPRALRTASHRRRVVLPEPGFSYNKCTAAGAQHTLSPQATRASESVTRFRLASCHQPSASDPPPQYAEIDIGNTEWVPAVRIRQRHAQQFHPVKFVHDHAPVIGGEIINAPAFRQPSRTRLSVSRMVVSRRNGSVRAPLPNFGKVVTTSTRYEHDSRRTRR